MASAIRAPERSTSIVRGLMASAWLLAAALTLLALYSALQADHVSISLKATLIAVATISLFAPHAGLLAVAGLTPLAAAVTPAGAVPSLRLAEALALAFLGGWLIRVTLTAARRSRARPDAAIPVLLFALAIACSMIVRMASVQAITDDPFPFGQAVWRFLTRDYLQSYADFPSVMAAALLLEGVALFVSVGVISKDHPSLPARLVRLTMAAAAGAAVLTFARLIVDMASGSLPDRTVAGVLRSARVGHLPDVNAVGSYFVMVWLIAIARSRTGAQWNYPAIATSALLAAAVWLSGSRTAMVAGVAMIIALAAWRTFGPRELKSRWIPQLAVAALAVLFVLVALGVDPRPPASRSVSNTMSTRLQFVETSVRMLATRPFFGVGVGRYYGLSGRFMPQGIYWFYFHENAHNNFLQIAAELGVVGLGLFLWILGAVLWRAWRALRVSPAGRDLDGLFFGVLAFLATCLTGHPLLVSEVAYPFWIVLGLLLVAAGARPSASSGLTAAPALLKGTRRIESVISATAATAAAAAVALVGSVPLRIDRELRDFDPTTINYGLSGPEFEEGGVLYHRMRDAIRLFIPVDALAIEIPLRADATNAPVDVDISLDGRLVNRVQAVSGNWQSTRILMPPASKSGRARRIDLTLISKDGPAAATPQDAPTVMVGQVQIIGGR